MDVNISISGAGLQFDSKVTLFQATQIMAFIAKPSDTAEVLLVDESIIPPTSDKKPLVVSATGTAYESPRQAIDNLNAKTNGQKIVAISLYLGASSQNGKILEHDDVISEFARAGEPKPSYFARDLKDAISAGYIYPETKKSFRLLSPADKVPEEGFKKAKRKRSVPKAPDGEKLQKPTVRSEVTSLALTTSLDGHIDYFDSPTKADQILWILRYAQANSLSSLNRLEIINISAKLGGDVNSKFFASSNASNVKNGYIASTGQSISLTIKGERHLGDLKKNVKE